MAILPYISLATTGSATPQQIPVFPTLPQGWSITKTPSWPGRSLRSVSGLEWRATDQTYPRYEWELTYPILRDGSYAKHTGGTGDGYDEFHDLAGFFNLFAGGFSTFLYDDPTDDSVVGQYIATGDGVNSVFQLQRTIGGTLPGGGWTDPIYAINAIKAVYLNGTPTMNYMVNYTSGQIRICPSLGNGVVVTVDFTYYWYVRFMQDSMNFENFLLQLWQNKSVKFTSFPNPGALPPPCSSGPPPTIDGIVSGTVTTSGATTITTPTLTTAHAGVIIYARFVTANGLAGGTRTSTTGPLIDTMGLTWTQRLVVDSAGGGASGPNSFREEIWWAYSPTIFSGTVTANFSPGLGAGLDDGTAYLEIFGIAGVANPSNPFSMTPSVQNVYVGSNDPTATYTTTQPHSLLLFMTISVSSAGAASAGPPVPPWTEFNSISTGAPFAALFGVDFYYAVTTDQSGFVVTVTPALAINTLITIGDALYG